MIKLDNCRWCGSDAKMETETSHLSKDPKPMYTVRCTSQYICSDLCYQCTSWHRSEKLAARAWNDRPISKHQQDIIKAAMKAIEKACENNPLRVGDTWSQGWVYHLRETREYLSPHLEALKGLIDD
jgi:hypothetical protein